MKKNGKRELGLERERVMGRKKRREEEGIGKGYGMKERGVEKNEQKERTRKGEEE